MHCFAKDNRVQTTFFTHFETVLLTHADENGKYMANAIETKTAVKEAFSRAFAGAQAPAAYQTLSHSVLAIIDELSDAQQRQSRDALKAQQVSHDMKMAHARTAARVTLEARTAEMEASFHRRVEEEVRNSTGAAQLEDARLPQWRSSTSTGSLLPSQARHREEPLTPPPRPVASSTNDPKPRDAEGEGEVPHSSSTSAPRSRPALIESVTPDPRSVDEKRPAELQRLLEDRRAAASSAGASSFP